MTTPTLREAAMAALPESVRFKLAAIAAECSDPGTTDALDELLESTALTSQEQSPADGPAAPTSGEPLGYISRSAVEWLTEQGRGSLAFVATEIHKSPGADVAIYLAAPGAPPPSAAQAEGAITDDMRNAVRWAPSSAYWSERLREFFGPDAREGINVLERRIATLTAAPEKLEGQAKFSVADLARAGGQKALPIMQAFARGGHNVTLNQQLGLAEVADALSAPHQQAAQPEPVHGDVLPAIGSRVFIRHGRDDDAHACTVTGYYVWPDLKGDKTLHRVFVRLVYEGTDTPQARMLFGCWPTKEAALAEATPPSPQQAAQGLHSLTIETRHPESYVLINEVDGTRWRGSADGYGWEAEQARAAQGGREAWVEAPFSSKQRRNLWNNSPELHKDAASFAGFERIVTLVEQAHYIGITTPAGDSE